MKKHAKRLFSLLMAVACAFSISLTALTPAYAVSQADIDALKKEQSSLDKKKKDLKTKLNSLAGDRAKILEQRKLLDEQASLTANEISNVETQISQYAALITQSQAELVEAEEKEEAQYALFCQRVRAMEKESKLDYWSVLFHATSFTDLLSRLDAVNEVMDADQRIMDELEALQADITARKERLETNKAESEAAKATLVTKKKSLDSQRAEAVALMKSMDSSKAEYQAVYDELEAEEERVQKRAVELSKKLAAEQAAAAAQNNGKGEKPANSNAALGGYIWPVSSHYVSSPYGKRPSPGGIGSRFHKGMDIGRVGYTTEVHAAKAGTVIVSQYSSSYGNYVVVSHGSGNTTLYAHMSSRKVEVGQYVKQGAPLGITGSTGRSTGPHLHFEITENGQRINPAKYLK